MTKRVTRISVCLAALVLFGCDAGSGNPRLANSPTNPKRDPAERIAELDEQNAELIQMLEEAEFKLTTILKNWDETKRELDDANARLQETEAASTAASKRFDQISSRVSEIRSEFADKMSVTAKQLEALSGLLPEPTEENDPDQDQAVEEKKPVPDDSSGN